MPPLEAFDAWRTILGEFYEITTPAARHASFAADMTTWNLGGVLLSQGMFTAQSFSRTPKRARKDGFDAFTIMIYRQGYWRADASGRICESGSGRVNLIDFAQPLAAEVTTNDSITVTFPRDFLDAAVRPHVLHGLVLEGACGGLVSDFLLSLSQRLTSLSAHEGPYVAAAVGNLLAACLHPTPQSAERAQPQLDALAFRRGQALIDANLHKASWGAEELRISLGVSRSTLYRIFAPVGGVAQQIRSRRLERAHAMLAGMDKPTRIYQVAESCGFGNETHFSRAFRQAYGYTAREAIGLRRMPARAHRAARAGSTDADFIDWIRRLRL